MLNGWTPIIIEWALIALSLIFVLLRIYVRFSVPTTDPHYKLADAIVIVAWLALAVMVVLDTVLSKLSLFDSASNFDRTLVMKNEKPEDNVRMLKIIYASVFPYTVAIYLVKAALLIWYYTITPKTLTRCRRALQLISALCVISFLLALGFSFLWCWPVSRNWTLEGPRICIASAQAPTFYITFACHILTDLLIFVYPFPLMRHARLARHDRRAWGIVILFALGFLAIACTLARVAATIMSFLTVTSGTTNVVAVWTTVECTTGIIIACCPALRILIQSSKPAARIHHHHHHHHDCGSSPKHHHGSTDTYASTYVSTNHTVRTTLAASEIWDGTDSTAPEWIRLGSRGMMHSGNGGMFHGGGGKDIEMGSFVSGCGDDDENDIKAMHTTHGCGGGGHGGQQVHSPASSKAPGFVLQPGRGIIQHAPGVAPSGGVPCWMDLPDPPFLSEKDEDDDDSDCDHSQKLNPPPPPSKTKLRWEVDDGGKEWDDGSVQENRDRWDSICPRACERLDRIVETLSEPAAATKRWSQGSFGDRNSHHHRIGRKDDDEEERAVISKEAFFFD